jgi:TM2 domain-containing membrane protein YozV
MASQTHSLTVGYLLWIFGFTGAHRFYFGKPLSGTVWFLTLGLFGVGWLFDLFWMPRLARGADARYASGPFDYTLAWILLTFFGYLGIHRFYLGKWITGLLYLGTFGLAGFGWLYDYLNLNAQVDARNRG